MLRWFAAGASLSTTVHCWTICFCCCCSLGLRTTRAKPLLLLPWDLWLKVWALMLPQCIDRWPAPAHPLLNTNEYKLLLFYVFDSCLLSLHICPLSPTSLNEQTLYFCIPTIENKIAFPCQAQQFETWNWKAQLPQGALFVAIDLHICFLNYSHGWKSRVFAW